MQYLSVLLIVFPTSHQLTTPGPRYEIVRAELKKLGYDVSAGLFNTFEFGPPQTRNRAWIIAGRNMNVDAAMLEAASFKMQPLPLSDFIFDNTKAARVLAAESGNESTREKKRKRDPSAKWHSKFEESCKKLGKAHD